MTALAATIRSSRNLLGWNVLLFYLFVLGASMPVWPFAWHLAMHVAGAAMLIGNAVVMAVWLSLAGFAGSDQVKRRAARIVNRADLWFTIPGAVLILANGLAMVAGRYGGPLAIPSIPWIAAGLVLLTLTGVVWAARLVPTQRALERVASASSAVDQRAFRRLLITWSVWGSLATVMPIVAAFLMSTKPTF